jgi:hypothetical protein
MSFTPVADADIRALIDMPAENPTVIYCDAANLLVTEQLVPAQPPMSDARLTIIAKYLGAHYACVTEELGGLVSSTASVARDDYANNNKSLGPGISSTRYGLQAIAFDTTGVLSALSASPMGKARIRVVRCAPYSTSPLPTIIPGGAIGNIPGSPPAGWPPAWQWPPPGWYGGNC